MQQTKAGQTDGPSAPNWGFGFPPHSSFNSVSRLQNEYMQKHPQTVPRQNRATRSAAPLDPASRQKQNTALCYQGLAPSPSAPVGLLLGTSLRCRRTCALVRLPLGPGPSWQLLGRGCRRRRRWRRICVSSRQESKGSGDGDSSARSLASDRPDNMIQTTSIRQSTDRTTTEHRQNYDRVNNDY